MLSPKIETDSNEYKMKMEVYEDNDISKNV